MVAYLNKDNLRGLLQEEGEVWEEEKKEAWRAWEETGSGQEGMG